MATELQEGKAGGQQDAGERSAEEQLERTLHCRSSVRRNVAGGREALDRLDELAKLAVGLFSESTGFL
eukprot:765350-Hanusia_phi.AAC.2